MTSRPTRDTPLLKRVCHAFSHGSTMARRHSLRLLGLPPEMPAFQDKCFICQSDLDIRSVLGCHMMPCCGKFIHHRCFHRAHQTSSQCGHCRLMPDEDTSSDDTLRANESLDESDDNPTYVTPETTPAYVTPPKLRGPTQIERARTAIADLRATSYAHTIHQQGSQYWDELPHYIDPMVWYMMWVNLDWFISTNPEGPRPLFIHTAIFLPVQPDHPGRSASLPSVPPLQSPLPFHPTATTARPLRLPFRSRRDHRDAHPVHTLLVAARLPGRLSLHHRLSSHATLQPINGVHWGSSHTFSAFSHEPTKRLCMDFLNPRWPP